MVIHSNYTTMNLLLDEPCNIDGLGLIYPIKVKEYQRFCEYLKYLTITKKLLKIEDDKTSLLQTLIILLSGMKCNEVGDMKYLDYAIYGTLTKFEEMFSMLTKKKIKFKDSNNSYIFEDDENTVLINDDNFEVLRKVVLKMCLISEPKVYEDELTQKWYEKARLAKKQDSANIEFEDIVITVAQDMKLSFKEVGELNMLQLYAYYYRANHVENYKAITLFKTCSDKMPKVNYSDGVMDSLYKEETLNDFTVDFNGINGML